MYSVILMAALTTNTADAPQFHKRGGGCMGGIVLHSGGYGSCMGCWGAGCWGAGNGYSGGCYGCMGCYGNWFGYSDYINAPSYNPGYYTSGNPMTVTSPPTTPTPPATGTGTGTGTDKPAGTTPMSRTRSYGAAAQLVVEKPADAKLFVDNIPISADTTTKTFTTPDLDPSQAYYYTVRVEMSRDGKPLTESRRVIVRAGETITETFREPSTISTVSALMPLVK